MYVTSAHPDVIGPLDGHVPQQIRINPMLRVRLAGLGRLIDRRQANLAHQPPDPVAPDAPAQTPQVPRHLACAVPRHLKEGLVDEPHEREVLWALARRLPVK